MEVPVNFKCFINYVFNSKGVKSGDMNKCTLFLVFICGVVFAGLVSILKSSINFENFRTNPYSTGIGVLPADAQIELMDDGYITMAALSASHVSDDYENLKNRAKRTELEERSTELEALNSLKAAVELVAAGKKARAGRLLEHAHSLAPRHHDVLLMYGEYLERHREDIVQADYMFLKALTASPSSSRALRNRKRTQSIVEKIDASLLERIDNKRNELAMIPSLSGALRRIKREAYFQHIYHTAAIEGNTLTLAQIRMILETGLSVGGKSVMEHNEILGIDLALKFINTTLVHRIGKISIKDILEIHRRVLGHVDPIGAGNMRTTQVFVSDHVPPPPSKIEVLMEGFVSWLNSPQAQSMHPIKYAALAHYKLVFIHPFVDGNGRTARLLMNFLLMQAGYPPVIIRKQDRLHYYEHLQTANDGDTRPFIRFVARCMEKTIDVYLWATQEHLPELEQSTLSKETTPNKEQHNMATVNTVPYLADIREEENMYQTAQSKDFTLDEHSYEAFPPKKRRAFDSLSDIKLVKDEEDASDLAHGSVTSSEWLIEESEADTEDYGRFHRVIDENDVYLSANMKSLEKILKDESSNVRNGKHDV